MNLTTCLRCLIVLLCVACAGPLLAQGVHVETPRYARGNEWSVVELDEPSLLPVFEKGWQRSTFWDLRPVAGQGRVVRWSVERSDDVGLDSFAESSGADLALCARETGTGRNLGCSLIATSAVGPTGPRAVWSNLPGEAAKALRVLPQLGSDKTLIAGMSYVDRRLDDEDLAETITGVALAEGIALTPAGPAEVVLVREMISGGAEERTVFRFIEKNGRTVAAFDVEAGVPVRGSVLTQADRFADDGLQIDYTTLSQNLTPGTVGFLQYSMDFSGVNCLTDTDCGLPNALCVGASAPDPGACRVPLSDLRSGWTGITDAIGIDQTGVNYQPDPDDPGTTQTLPEVWEFATLNTSVLNQRTFNTIRDDTGWSGCLESCAVKDQTATPPDGSWQAYLKIDNYNASGTFVTRDVFTFNDNDTGANPSIDVPYLVQDQANASDRNQICFDDSGGNPADRLLEFFQFSGPDPASATLGVGDNWVSGNWTSCNSGSGLHLTIASSCGDLCYPACPDSPAAPRARGLLGGGAGLGGSIQEDGYMHVAAGNYVPALLLLQETDLEAGANFILDCVLATTRLRGIDWFWLHERYGLLALISGPNDDGNNGCGEIQPMDWSCFDNRTDGVDFTWGPFPPYQISAEACLNGTKIDWALPADGSNLTGEPNISNWGYVVSWGTENDPDLLADWTGNPNHSPLPLQGGYLAAPPGSEPTSYVISGWGGASINATVTTALSYTDPDVTDVKSYRSAAFFRVVQDPAKLDPLVFQVGDTVAPFVTEVGAADLDLSWPAVGDATSYAIEVFDLATKSPVGCPAGLDCAPTGTSTTFSGGKYSPTSYGFRVFAVDGCGDPSLN